ncbi:MAG: TRAP transporter large permease subunit [Rhodospirillaceae bacterium]|nr:TRAP transporter large permease subunit [Rhodospirillaceae bacterium]
MGAPVAVVLTSLTLLLGAGVWVGFSLMGVGLISLTVFRDIPAATFLAFDIWNSLNTPELVALPLFILMGEILFHTRLSETVFRGLAPWIGNVPGRLLHVNVVGCTLFAAVSGSSAATTATIGRMTLAELKARGYDEDLAMGSLCGAGTLGFLIPPSIILILYGVLSETSIIDLFVAGIVPGFILAASYMAYIAARAVLTPDLIPTEPIGVSWADRIRALKDLVPILGLIGVIIGSMYSGIASPTEAATVGVAGALVLAALQKAITRETISLAFLGAIKTCSMIGLIIAGALFLSKTMAFLGLPQAVAGAIGGLNLSPFGLILLLTVFYIVLGCVIDGLSAIVMTLALVLPLVSAAGFDQVWFGIFLVIVVEMSQITPPVGFNLFVVQGLTGAPIGRIARASLPFFLIMFAMVIMIALVPDLVTFLPRSM